MDDLDVFLKAIDVLTERGWSQGRSGDEGACIDVALWEATDGVEASFGWACARMRPLVGCVSLWQWNDDPGRTYEDVVLALKRAAAGEAA